MIPNSDNLLPVLKHLIDTADKYGVENDLQQKLSVAIQKLSLRASREITQTEVEKSYSSKNRKRKLRKQLQQLHKLRDGINEIL